MPSLVVFILICCVSFVSGSTRSSTSTGGSPCSCPSKTCSLSALSISFIWYSFLSASQRTSPPLKYLPSLISSVSQASSPLNFQAQPTVSFHRSLEAGLGLSGPPLPVHLPMNSLSPCRASRGVGSFLSAARATRPSARTHNRAGSRFIADQSSGFFRGRPGPRVRRAHPLDEAAAGLVPRTRPRRLSHYTRCPSRR